MNSLNKIDEETVSELYDVLLSLKTKEDCKAFFNDLCTVNEIHKMAQRVQAAKMLINGKTYNEVIEKTDISSATLSRVSHCVQYGNGYVKFLK